MSPPGESEAPQGADQGRAVLVTGGSGFIGTNLVADLGVAGERVLSLDPAPPRDSSQREVWRQGDLTDRAAVRAAVAELRPGVVFHLGARTDLDGRSPGDYAVNTDGTRNLLEALAGLDPAPRLIAASTRMVLPIGVRPRGDEDFDPPNAYGESKVEMERLLRASGYPGAWAIVRPTSIWGPWFDAPYRDFFGAVARGRYRHPRGRRILKSFGYVENTAAQLLALAAASAGDIDGRVFYLADYEPLEVFDWAESIAAATGGPRVRSLPRAGLRVVALAGDALHAAGWKQVPLTSFRLRNLTTEMLYDLEPIRAIAPRLPVGLDDGVARTAEWMREQGDLAGRAEASA